MQKELAISLGVKEEDIIELHTPKRYKRRSYRNKNITKMKKVILVTSASHMKRAVKLFFKKRIKCNC